MPGICLWLRPQYLPDAALGHAEARYAEAEGDGDVQEDVDLKAAEQCVCSAAHGVVPRPHYC